METVTPCDDPILGVEIFLNELFQKIFGNDAARHHLGFKNISQSTTLEGAPLWYIWFEDQRGAYSLTLRESYASLDAYDLSGKEKEAEREIEPYFEIRYFPDMDEAVFDSLSCYEQLVRMGPQFDSTGTPTYDGGQRIPARFFVAGRMDIEIKGAKSDVDLRCTAPTRWHDYRIDGLMLVDNGGNPLPVLSPGELDRDFPGWDLSFFLFRKIVSAFCINTGQAPKFSGLARKSSCHYRISAEEEIEMVDDPRIIESVFGVAFFENSRKTKRYGSFESVIRSHGHTLVGIWDSPEAIPDVIKVPEWWTIHHQHFHCDPNHLCSCYTS
jgi:hypothetical protein